MRSAVAFLTVLGGSARPGRRTLAWFPLVGALLGLLLGGVWWGAGEIWPLLVAAAVVVAADLALTGLLHVDGLADSADGLLPPLASPERRLEVMADPTTGAFGVAVVGIALILRTVALASVAPHALVLAGLWAASRTLMAVAALALPYARPGGLAASFIGGESAVGGGPADPTDVPRSPAGGRPRPPALVLGAGGLVLSLLLAGLGAGVPAIAAVAALSVGGCAVLALARQRLGGFTGDVLGAAAVVGETAGLLALAARW